MAGFGKQSFNQVQIEGVVTAFNEQTSKAGKKFAKCNLRDVNNAEFNFTVFGEASLDAAYNASQKRGNVVVCGRLESRPYQDKKGETRSSLEIVVFNVFPIETAAPVATRGTRTTADEPQY